MTRNARKKILASHCGLPCAYCGVSMTVHEYPVDSFLQTDATIEHMHPTSRGGDRNTYVVACLGCNRDKGDLTLNEWRAALSVRYTTVCVFWFERRIPSILLDYLLWGLLEFGVYTL